MDYKKLENIKVSFEKAIYTCFELIISLVNICITVFLVFGSAAAIILLYKTFPEVASTFMKPIFAVFSIMIKIIYAFLIALALILYGYIIILTAQFLKKSREKRKKEKKKFLDDIVKKIKSEFKK